MVSWHGTVEDLLDMLADMMCFKAGVLLTAEKIASLLSDDAECKKFLETATGFTVMEYGELEDIIEYLLWKLGRLKNRYNPPIYQGLLPRMAKDNTLQNRWLVIRKKFGETIELALKNTGVKVIDPKPFLDFTFEKFGTKGLELAVEMLDDYSVQAFKNAVATVRTDINGKRLQNKTSLPGARMLITKNVHAR